MELEFTGELFYWRGPAPYHFVSVPDGGCADLKEISRSVSYGWGVIPVTVRIGETEWTTSPFPKDGGYVVPVKSWVRAAETLEDRVVVTLTVVVGRP
ncbi:MAG: DUF1905 domain-containing protein [Nakamurella sp.]